MSSLGGVQDEEIDRMHNLFARIGKEEYPMEDMSAEDWLRSQVQRHYLSVKACPTL